MSKRLRALAEKKEKLLEAATAIKDNPAGEGEGDDRELSDDQRVEFNAKIKALETINADIDAERRLIDEARTATPLEFDQSGDISGGEPVILKDPKFGFESFGEQCHAIMQANKKTGARLDERLELVAAAPTTYGSEGVGADGGFLVAPEFSSEIFQHSLEGDAILPLTDNQSISGNSITYPKDETTPWGSDGIRVRWEAEAAAATETKPVLGYTSHRLHKLIGLVPLTSELMEDAAAMGAFASAGLARSIRWKTNDAFVNGTGAGQPEGIANCDALISVAKDTAISPDQAADTILTSNIAAMYSRMPSESLGNAVWMINHDVLPQLIPLVIGNYPVFTPPGGLPNAPAGSLLGRPIMISQHCQTLGDVGDIYFVDWMQYRSITKAGGIQTATSMHLYFDADAVAFRATFRVDGGPKIASAISPANGSNTLSPFITLAARA